MAHFVKKKGSHMSKALEINKLKRPHLQIAIRTSEGQREREEMTLRRMVDRNRPQSP